MSVSQKSGGQKQCCTSCGKCFKGSQPSKKTIKQSSSCCSGSKKGTAKWVCTLRNDNLIRGIRCANDQDPTAEWNCVATWNWSGPPVYTDPKCPGSNTTGCAKAMIAAQNSIKALHPNQQPTTPITWNPADPKDCPLGTCPGGPCGRASYSRPAIDGTTIDDEATWNC